MHAGGRSNGLETRQANNQTVNTSMCIVIVISDIGSTKLKPDMNRDAAKQAIEVTDEYPSAATSTRSRAIGIELRALELPACDACSTPSSAHSSITPTPQRLPHTHKGTVEAELASLYAAGRVEPELGWLYGRKGRS
jgi:hypothetical protein